MRRHPKSRLSPQPGSQAAAKASALDGSESPDRPPQSQPARPHPFAALLLAIAAMWVMLPDQVLAEADPQGRPIARVDVKGLQLVGEALVRNQLRATQGTAYDKKVIAADVVRLTHLGRFSSITPIVQPLGNGSLVLVWNLVEQPLLADVQVAGNKLIPDEAIIGRSTGTGFAAGMVGLQRGDPVDEFLIAKGRERILAAYEKQGYFQTVVTYDKRLLAESRILIFKVREGPQLVIKEVRFEGNRVFSDKELDSKIKSRAAVFIIRKGQLNRDQLEKDVAAIRQYYLERGYLDVAVGRQISTAPNQKDAIITFVIDEGRRYTVNEIGIEGNTIFGDDQIALAMDLRVGDVFAADRLRKSQRAVTDLYGKLGFINARVVIERVFDERKPQVRVVVRITEGRPYIVGQVIVKGNAKTKDKTVLRQIRGMQPGRRFDGTGIAVTQQRLTESPLFTDAKLTILGDPTDEERDVLVEVTEGSTASFNFGAAVSSDSGVVGAIGTQQRNFDISDFPESISELFSGQAFKGAGQFFSVNLQPGNEQSRYSVSFREPYLFDSNIFFSMNAFIFERERDDWDEARLGGTVSLGQRFGDVWSGSVVVRAEQVEIDDIQPDAPVDVLPVMGENLVTSIGFSVSRDTTNSRIFPSEGSKLSASISRIGMIGGDFDFTKGTLSYRKYWTIDEDFLERRTVLIFRSELGIIFEDNESPLFEKFYAGGHRTFRGFEFRGMGPRGIRIDTMMQGDDAVGGDFMLLTGFEYNYPIYERILRGVFFVDMGTLANSVKLSDWRVSVGAGIRLSVPVLGQVPVALDLAIPVSKQTGDQTQFFSFDIAFPF